MIGRFFWPLGSIDSAGHLMQLATDMQSLGLRVSVVTPRFAAGTAERFHFREIDVHRPVRIFRTGWSVRSDRTPSRYIRNLRQWIVDHSASYDLVYCDGLAEEAIAGVEAAGILKIPSVVRYVGPRIGGGTTSAAQSRMERRFMQAGQSADALVMSCAADQRSWISQGGESEKIHRITSGVGPTPLPADPSPAPDTSKVDVTTQMKLRHALAGINGDFFVPEQHSVILSVERMHSESGLMQLVEQAYSLSEKIPFLHYWLVGDGPARDSIFTRMRSDGLRQVTAMPGSFGLLDDIFAAADLMIHVGEEGYDSQIPAAVAAGLPLVMAETPAAREFFNLTGDQIRAQILEQRASSTAGSENASLNPVDLPSAWVNWFNPARPRTLRLAIERITGDLTSARERAVQLRRHMQLHRPRRSTMEAYARLFHRLAGRQNGNAATRTSAETSR